MADSINPTDLDQEQLRAELNEARNRLARISDLAQGKPTGLRGSTPPDISQVLAKVQRAREAVAKRTARRDATTPMVHRRDRNGDPYDPANLTIRNDREEGLAMLAQYIAPELLAKGEEEADRIRAELAQQFGARTSGEPGRPFEGDPITVRIPRGMLMAADKLARELGHSRAGVVRRALAEYLIEMLPAAPDSSVPAGVEEYLDMADDADQAKD